MWLLLPLLTTSLVIVSLLMIIVVLMQRPKSEGLGAAFGSSMTDSLFGTQTSTILNRFTVWLGGLFFLLTLIISVVYARSSSGPTKIQEQLMKQPAPMIKKEIPLPTPVSPAVKKEGH
ncbi:MAG: preprotein translocase subunit SecG [Verrucomicrobia bacterium]|jgi:preprotein translocase subunit SecG|nr:MAG: preprotein translocase subunit SecG [Verrucomicrobiota bacterium]